MNWDQLVKDLTQTPLGVLIAIAFILLLILLILLNGSINSIIKRVLEWSPAGRRNAKKDEKAKENDTTPITQTMIAIGQLSAAMLQMSQVIAPMVEEMRASTIEQKRSNDIQSAQVAEFTTQHKEVIRRFEVHEERTDQRTAQMNNLLTQFNGAVASLKENNTLIRNVVDNETKSFEVREKATAAINGQMQAMSLALTGINKSVGKVGTTMTDVGGEVEGIKEQLESLNKKVDGLAAIMARLELDVRNLLQPAPPPILGPLTHQYNPGDKLPVLEVQHTFVAGETTFPVNQSEVKTATLPPTTPLEAKSEAHDAKPEPPPESKT